MKNKLIVLLDKDGKILAGSIAKAGASFATPIPSDPQHTIHEIEISEEFAAQPTDEALQTAVATYLLARENRKKEKLHPVTLEEFVQETYGDPNLKLKRATELQHLGFCAFTETYFELSDHQKQELATVRERDIENAITETLLLAIRRNGPIRMIHEGHNPPNMKVDVDIECGGNGCIVYVTLTC